MVSSRNKKTNFLIIHTSGDMVYPLYTDEYFCWCPIHVFGWTLHGSTSSSRKIWLLIKSFFLCFILVSLFHLFDTLW